MVEAYAAGDGGDGGGAGRVVRHEAFSETEKFFGTCA